MPQSNQRILVVDDDALIRDMFAKGLRQFSYQCTTAGSADEATLILQGEDFDLMLLDIAMPGKTGLFLLPELAERYPDMAVIMVTGHDELETAVYAMRQGADDYLAKPVAMTLLVHRIEKVLSRRTLLLENKAYREQLENMVSELNQRLEQSKRIVAALNTLVQSPNAQDQSGLESTVTDFGSGIERLADSARSILTEFPDAPSPD